MAVVLDVTQSGSGSTKISAEPGDTITFELAETIHSGELANSLAGFASMIQAVHGVTVAINTTDGAN
jgi:hypothetical protein